MFSLVGSKAIKKKYIKEIIEYEINEKINKLSIICFTEPISRGWLKAEEKKIIYKLIKENADLIDFPKMMLDLDQSFKSKIKKKYFPIFKEKIYRRKIENVYKTINNKTYSTEVISTFFSMPEEWQKEEFLKEIRKNIIAINTYSRLFNLISKKKKFEKLEILLKKGYLPWGVRKERFLVLTYTQI